MSPKKALAEGFVDEILYTEPGQDPPIENSFMFSRMAIQNSASLALQRFIEQYNQINPLDPGPPPPQENQAEKDLVFLRKAQVQVNKNKIRRH